MSETAPEPAQPVEPGAEPEPATPGELWPDEQPEQQPDPQSPAEPDTGEEEGKDLAAEVAKWKAMARKHEQEAKKNSAAARKYAEWEDSQKTEQQRLADRLAAAEQERDDARRSHARLMAAATHNIPASLIDRISGSTEEEINESAEALAAEIDRLVAARLAEMPQPLALEPAPAGPASTRPVESLTPGARPANQPPEDPNAWLRAMAGRGG